MRVQLLVEGEDAGDAADVVGEVLVFVGGEGAAEEGGLAVAEPLLEDLVAAEGVVTDGLGHVFPAGGGVEVDVELALAGMQWIVSTDVIRHRPLVLFAAWGYLVCGPLFLWIDSHVGLPNWWVAMDSLSCLFSGIILLWACRPRK